PLENITPADRKKAESNHVHHAAARDRGCRELATLSPAPAVNVDRGSGTSLMRRAFVIVPTRRFLRGQYNVFKADVVMTLGNDRHAGQSVISPRLRQRLLALHALPEEMERLQEATPAHTVVMKLVREVNLKASSIKKYLKPNTILSRKSTFSNAFASALAPYDVYSDAAVTAAIKDLNQNPAEDLYCVYCGKEAATWDHVFNRVVNGEFSGYGHRIRNLVPCCRTCNERKGKKYWKAFLELINPVDKDQRVDRIERFLRAHAATDDYEIIQHKAPEELHQFLQVRAEIFRLMEKADKLAEAIRKKATT
ncbi:HNH endonuclease, partial [Celeribacter sp.]|uniref:HNH endonuclease n=1 Tax=Celeribacter sp. TaxID=1890673 RepID=UPI003A8EC347